MTGLDDRPWWVFQYSGVTSYVPADTEVEARTRLVADLCREEKGRVYQCVGSRFCSREALAASLLRQHKAGVPTSTEDKGSR